MIQIICGEKGKGKTKIMLEKANECMKQSKGSVVYLDKTPKHMFELDNGIRLINISEYSVHSYDVFIGFIAGLISGNHDIECVFLDSFLKISCIDENNLVNAVKELESISNDILFVLSISLSEQDIPEEIKDKISVSC